MPGILGFTGSSTEGPAPTRDQLVLNLESLIERLQPERIVTGACVGVDSFVHHFVGRYYPSILRTVVFPGDTKAVDPTVERDADEVIWMPVGSSYRLRNEKLVSLSEVFAAFWSGNERSGTFMTMNIAQRKGELPLDNIYGHGLPNEVVRDRYKDYLRGKSYKGESL